MKSIFFILLFSFTFSKYAICQLSGRTYTLNYNDTVYTVYQDPNNPKIDTNELYDYYENYFVIERNGSGKILRQCIVIKDPEQNLFEEYWYIFLVAISSIILLFFKLKK